MTSQTLSPPAALLSVTGSREVVSGYGAAIRGECDVCRPASVDELRSVLQMARDTSRTIGPRGAGCSYGDANINSNQLVLDLQRLNQIQQFDRQTGLVTVSPGVTIEQLWRHTLPQGWWPPVVTGTMRTTIGGCAAMNVHGKNAWHAGPIGDHIVEFDVMTVGGETLTCSRNINPECFFAVIGGFGMLGVITSVTLQLKPVTSGYVDVREFAEPNLSAVFERFETLANNSDYLVAWIDAFSGGRSVGRGHVHCASHVDESGLEESLQQEIHELPTHIAGIFPRSQLWRCMRHFWNDLGVRMVNFGKFTSARTRHGRSFRSPIVPFQFLLDSIPNFQRCHGPGGMIQHQVFVPEDRAHDVFENLLRLQQQRGIVNYLTVLKKHRCDDFLMSYGVDGFSLAQDFRVTKRNRNKVWALCHEMDDIVTAAGGRFYFAKDATLRPQTARESFGENAIAQFLELKQLLDPDMTLQTDLWRRVMQPLL